MVELETVLSILIPTLASIASLAYWLGRKFEAIDRRFEAIDRRFEEVDRRFGAVEKRFEGVDKRFDELERRFEGSFEAFKNAVLAMNTMLVEFMGLKGLFTPQESRFPTSEMNRIISAFKPQLNPLTKEEYEFVVSVLSKEDPDKITIEEAEKIAEIGKRWWKEDGLEVAYRLFLTGEIIKAYHLGKRQ
jgi:hypothetical protein